MRPPGDNQFYDVATQAVHCMPVERMSRLALPANMGEATAAVSLAKDSFRNE